MKNLYKPSSLISYLSSLDVKLKKSLSQNFLIDKNIIDKMISSANILSDDIILEIGAGAGVLTFEIAKKAKKVIAIEKDDIFAKELKNCRVDNIETLNIDFLKFDLNDLKKIDKKIKVISSIPYSLTTPIITKLLNNFSLFSSITLMVQKEMAQKIIAKSSTKLYGFFSVFVQFYSDAKIIQIASKNCFLPKPKVDSAIIELKIKNDFFKTLDQNFSFEKFLLFVKK